jgi:hypothetical protein
MRDRYWLGVGARLLAGVVIIAWALSYLGTGSGEKEFQKTLKAMKQVHSFRVTSASSAGTQHSEALWEVDCDHDRLHYQWHGVVTSTSPPIEIKRDEITVAGREYDRQTDGSWASPKYSKRVGSTKSYCGYLAQGTDSNLLPPIATMIQRGVIQKGDKKTVNGVRCREWLVAMRGFAPGRLEHDAVCLGLADHLPYEMTLEWEHTTFSDYNRPIHLDLPEAALQSTSANDGSK